MMKSSWIEVAGSPGTAEEGEELAGSYGCEGCEGLEGWGEEGSTPSKVAEACDRSPKVAHGTAARGTAAQDIPGSGSATVLADTAPQIDLGTCPASHQSHQSHLLLRAIGECNDEWLRQ